jgi:hypothetical protein
MKEIRNLLVANAATERVNTSISNVAPSQTLQQRIGQVWERLVAQRRPLNANPKSNSKSNSKTDSKEEESSKLTGK